MSAYEQLKDDLGYLQLNRAAESFAALAETARHNDWTHIQFLAALIPRRQHPLRETPPHAGHHQSGSTDWGQIFGGPVVAAAILDRLMHNAVVFNIKGRSWRLREHQALTTATTTTYCPPRNAHPCRFSLIMDVRFR